MLHVASVCTPCCICCWMLVRKVPKRSATMLDPFAQLFQNCWSRARLLRMVYKDLWAVSLPRCTEGPNIVGSCCIRLHTTTNTHATTPKITLLFHLISRVLNFAKNRTSEQTNSNNRKNNFIVHNSHPRRPRGSQ